MHRWFGEIPNESGIDILQITAGCKLEMYVYRQYVSVLIQVYTFC